jgi:hypothetical protein
MSQSPLHPCPGCKRHVRTEEARCPFCGGAMPAPRAASSLPRALGRMSRTALFAATAAGATLAGAAAGCDGDSPGGGDAAADQAADQAVADGAGGDGANRDTGNMPDVGTLPPYGIPPMPDGGFPVAEYGAPPAPPTQPTGAGKTRPTGKR